MAKRKSNLRRNTRSRKRGSGRQLGHVPSLAGAAARKLVVPLVLLVAVGAAGVGAALGFTRLEAHVLDDVCAGVEPFAEFPDLSPRLATLAKSDLHSAASDALGWLEWTDDALCKTIADSVTATGWVARVHRVQRLSNGRVDIQCSYRHPVAMVQAGHSFFFVGKDAIRLPGEYNYDGAYVLIQGPSETAPGPGEPWPGSDVPAALGIWRELSVQPFHRQVTAILVHNFEGRRDALRPHIELATDRAGGRILWGSAPGLEIEENSVAQKLAILKANFLQTGRIDAHHPVIDVSTFPDRFTVPRP